jgi:hypothetical protein
VCYNGRVMGVEVFYTAGSALEEAVWMLDGDEIVVIA